MKQLLIAWILLTACPAYAFGDPSEAGAAAWCGARRRGESIDEANRQLRKTISAQLMMSTSFASGIAGLLNNRDGMQSQIDYYTSKMCPDVSTDHHYPPTPDSGTAESTLSSAENSIEKKYLTQGVIGIAINCLTNGRSSASRCDDVFIVGLAKDGPADKDGRIRKGDRLIEVNGQRIRGKGSKEIALLIGGEPGTYVVLVVEVNGSPRPITLLRERRQTVTFPK